MGHGLDLDDPHQQLDDFGVAPMGFEEFLAHAAAHARHGIVAGQARHLEADFPRQAVSIRVQARRRQADHHVARLDARPVNDLGAVHYADDGPGQVVFVFVVHAGHLGRLAADQGASRVAAARRDPANHLDDNRGVKDARGYVVQEEQRPRALDQDVVHAMRHEVDAHGVVFAGHEGELELRAHAVDAGHEHRGLHARGVEAVHGAEAADILQNALVKGPLDDILDPVNRFVGGVDVDPGVTIAQGGLFICHHRFLVAV